MMDRFNKRLSFERGTLLLEMDMPQLTEQIFLTLSEKSDMLIIIFLKNGMCVSYSVILTPGVAAFRAPEEPHFAFICSPQLP